MAHNGNGLRASIARWLARGWEEEPYRPPEKRTWAEKVTDDANAWLVARRLEFEGDVPAAARAYAQDAAFWQARGHYPRAALSTACEARCAIRLGVDGVQGFDRAGGLYLEAGRRATREDPREALYLFERARECFERAGNAEKADESAGLCESFRSALDVSAAYR